MAVIKVNGGASHKIQAEEGKVRISLRTSGPTRAEALSSAAVTHKALTSTAQQHVDGGAATRWDAESVTVWRSTAPVERASEGEPAAQPVTEYRAGGSIQVVFRDFAALGAFVAEAGALTDVDVDGVIWQVTDETRRQVEREVRVAAGKDAAARAAAYADALGLGVPTLDELVEDQVDFMFGGPRRRAIRKTPRGMQSLSATTADGGDALEEAETERFTLRPSEMTVSAEVSAVFTAT